MQAEVSDPPSCNLTGVVKNTPVSLCILSTDFRILSLDIPALLWLNVPTKQTRRTPTMKEYEIHVSATYTTDGGTREGAYFVEYRDAKTAKHPPVKGAFP